MKRVWSWLCLGIFWFTCGHALAQQLGNVPVRPISVAWSAVPALSFSARDFVDQEVVAKLQSGLPQTLTTRIYVYSDFDHEPLAVAAVSCRIIYDLWEGGYRVERQTEASDRTLSVKSLDGVIAQCLTFQNHTVGDVATYRRMHGSDVYFAVVTELNPLSRDAVQRIRRWLARPAGNELNGNAFFGTFVSIFVGRKLGAADKTNSFRSVASGVPP
ncbi:MAG: hypothetical protein RL701_3664 [Pseudomonadota bacterium]